jgi:predicted dienelactone hydrolase
VARAGAAAVEANRDWQAVAAAAATGLIGDDFRHDDGQVWVDIGVMLTAGGEAVADDVARVLDEAIPAALKRVEKARAPQPRNCCQFCAGLRVQ